MIITKILSKGLNSQAILIPEEFHLSVKEVWIKKSGDKLIIKPKPESRDDFFFNALSVTEDFSMERK